MIPVAAMLIKLPKHKATISFFMFLSSLEREQSMLQIPLVIKRRPKGRQRIVFKRSIISSQSARSQARTG
jgi:hypothetical protein